MDKPTRGMYVSISILMLALAQSACAGDSNGITYEITSDSMQVRVVEDGAELISANELLFSLPDSVYAVEYGKSYFILPAPVASDTKPWRRLQQLSVAPDGQHVAVVANTGGGIDVLVKRVADGLLLAVGWWHHTVADSLFWSPDSRYLLIPVRGMGEKSVLLFLELTPEATDPVRKATVWESGTGWVISGNPPQWDMKAGTATVSLSAVPTESGHRSESATGTSDTKVIRFTPVNPDSTHVPLQR